MKREPDPPEVDMVPMIDIVTLLLMFLIIVGDMTKSATGVKMKLPRATQAKGEKELNVSTEGRLVVQLRKDEFGKFWAIVENNKYELVPRGESASLQQYFQAQIERRLVEGRTKKNEDGSVPFPVKLRVPGDAPMLQVERIMMTMAKVGLVNIHYAAFNSK